MQIHDIYKSETMTIQLQETTKPIPIKKDGPEPVCEIAQSIAKTFIRKWITSKFREEWNQQERLRQSRTFIIDPMDRSEAKRLLSLNRNQLRAFVGVLIGHSLVNYHLYNIGLSNESDCRFCGKEDERRIGLTE